MFSPAVLISGIVLTVGGVIVGGIGGLMMYGAKDRGECETIEHPERCDVGDDKQYDTGTALGLSGIGGLVIGIVLIVVGARQVPVEDEPDQKSATARRDRAQPWPTVLVGPQGAGLSWRF
jgi:hypothetical protein